VAAVTVEPTIPAQEPEVLEPVRARGPKPMSPRADRYAQMVALAALLAGPAIMCLHAAVANDPDIWWHLRTGEWITQHRLIPRTDIFSGPNAGKPWPAYSWLFEVLVFQIVHRLGLVGIVSYSVGMVFAITCALYRLVNRLSGDFTGTALLVFASCFAMGHLYTPRPWLFTILFLILEVDILMQARRTGRLRGLLWLPLIFAVWSNIHIQFIDGLVVLGLALIEPVAALRGIGQKTRLGVAPAAAVLGASTLATMVNPFGWHIFRVAYDLAAQPGVLDKINELKAIPFRDAADWTILALTLLAVAALARSLSLRVFEVGLFAFAIFTGFRSQRDVWMIAIAAAVILAAAIPPRQNQKNIRLRPMAMAVAGLVAAVLLIAGFRVMKVNDAMLEREIEKTYPVHAVAAIQAGHYPGPLYNDFNWGGYLIWTLRMPVAVDGRAAFYGDEALNRSVATWNAEPDWNKDPLLQHAGIVVGPTKAALMQVLRMDPKYRLVYEDKKAVVFVALHAPGAPQR